MMRNRERHEKYFHPNFSLVPSVALVELPLNLELLQTDRGRSNHNMLSVM